LGGSSSRALLSAYIALQHPTIFDDVRSQPEHSDRAWQPEVPNQIHSPRRTLKCHICRSGSTSTQVYEPFPGRSLDELALDESNTAGNRHFRDVLKAKGYDVTYRETGADHSPVHWRATLPETLMELLGPK
jgi:enterochelin esterase-like enzyme